MHKNIFFEKKYKIPIWFTMWLLTILWSGDAFCQLEKRGDFESKKSQVCGSCRKSNVKISYWENNNGKDSLGKGITLLFGEGFDSASNLSVYLKRRLIKNISCKTNYSIDYCVDSIGNIVSVYISYENFKSNSNIKICTKNEFILIQVPNNVKSYNRLKIFKENGWNASFIKDFTQYILE